MSIPVSPAVEAAARALEFTSSPSGPLVAVPRMVVHAWRGWFDEDGEPELQRGSDYARANAVRDAAGVIPVGQGQALVLSGPQRTAFHRTAQGGYLIRWMDARSPAALLAAAVGVRTGWVVLPDTWQVPPGGALLLPAATPGKRLGPGDALDLPLSTGTYAVELLRSWDGDVIRTRGVEEVLVQAVRLRRLLG